MTRSNPRRLGPALVLAVAALALAACSGMVQYPNSVFNHTSDYNDAILALWNQILLLGTIVFVFVEGLLILTIFKFRKREGGPPARPIHGNTTLEIAWTAIPAIVLVFIAVPTVKTIYKTQSPAPGNVLQVDVWGHQWWWEFRYPQYGITTANELYLPVARTVSFTLRSRDVIHSFWTPQLSGKRDLITNKTNYLWYTPYATLADSAWNGFCTEYCGMSHANMRFRVYTVKPEEFESWAGHQKDPAMGSPTQLAAQAAADSAAKKKPVAVAKAGVVPAPAPAPAAPSGFVFPKANLKPHNIPNTPIPAGLTFADNLLPAADAKRGHDLVTNPANLGKAPCLTCHVINGEKGYVNDDQAKGPNLTHVGTRHTFAGGLFPADAGHLARWVKNAPHMKPGSLMNTFGNGEYNPVLKGKVTAGLSDAEIADIVAYLLSLK